MDYESLVNLQMYKVPFFFFFKGKVVFYFYMD